MTDLLKQSKQTVLERDGYRCHKCGKYPIYSVAHRIANTKTNIAKYGANVVNHAFNLVTACDQCNDSYNIGFKLGTSKKLIELIKDLGNEPMDDATVDFINDYLEVNNV